MANDETETERKEREKRGCCVCGALAGEMVVVDKVRYHSQCGATHPDVIAAAKAGKFWQHAPFAT